MRYQHTDSLVNHVNDLLFFLHEPCELASIKLEKENGYCFEYMTSLLRRFN